MYAWHLNTTSGLSTLVSSKVNQWTLLVGTLPLVFAVASGTATGLPVGPAQREELLLTAAQSLFAVAVLVNLEISVREAAALSGLFLVQFALAALVPGATELVALAVTYLVLAAVLLLRARQLLGPLLRDGLHPLPPAHRPARGSATNWWPSPSGHGAPRGSLLSPHGGTTPHPCYCRHFSYERKCSKTDDVAGGDGEDAIGGQPSAPPWQPFVEHQAERARHESR